MNTNSQDINLQTSPAHRTLYNYETPGTWFQLYWAHSSLATMVEDAMVDAAMVEAAMAAATTVEAGMVEVCLLYTSPSPRDGLLSRMPSSA